MAVLFIEYLQIYSFGTWRPSCRAIDVQHLEVYGLFIFILLLKISIIINHYAFGQLMSWTASMLNFWRVYFQFYSRGCLYRLDLHSCEVQSAWLQEAEIGVR